MVVTYFRLRMAARVTTVAIRLPSIRGSPESNSPDQPLFVIAVVLWVYNLRVGRQPDFSGCLRGERASSLHRSVWASNWPGLKSPSYGNRRS
jgi:hypothetical protein